MVDYSKCPFCQQKLQLIERGGIVIAPKGCNNSTCGSQFTIWNNGDSYFIKSFHDQNGSSTEFLIESCLEMYLTNIRIMFKTSLLADIDKIYNLSDPQELDQLLKIVNRLYKNLSLR